MEEARPELGQALHGNNVIQKFDATTSREIYTAIKLIQNYFSCMLPVQNGDEVLNEGESPFDMGSGYQYTNGVFETVGYQWDETAPRQEYNFKWRDIRVSWYKQCGRGMTINREMDKPEIQEMIRECIASIKSVGN